MNSIARHLPSVSRVRDPDTRSLRLAPLLLLGLPAQLRSAGDGGSIRGRCSEVVKVQYARRRGSWAHHAWHQRHHHVRGAHHTEV